MPAATASSIALPSSSVSGVEVFGSVGGVVSVFGSAIIKSFLSEKLYKNREDVHYQNENGAFRGAKFDDKFLDSIWDEMLN